LNLKPINSGILSRLQHQVLKSILTFSKYG